MTHIVISIHALSVIVPIRDSWPSLACQTSSSFRMKGMAVLSSPDAYQESHAGDDRRSGIIVFNVVCYALSVVAVLLRVVSRSLAKVETRADD